MIQLELLEQEIESLPVVESSLKNIAISRVFIENTLVQVDELEATEIIKTMIRQHFKFNADVIKGLIKYYKEEREKNLKSQPKENYQESILQELEQAPKYVEINPAQDFAEGRMIFTFYGGNTPCIVTSSKKIIKFEDVEDYRIKIRNDNVPMSNLSTQVAIDYVRGQEVNLKSCLNKIIEHIKRFIILQDHKLYTYLGLWIIGTYMYRVFRYYPYIWINADKGSGKSRIMEVICPISFNGLMSTNQTQATVFRSVDVDGCTLFIDEFEKMNDDMQQGILTVLNGGFNVDSGNTSRMEKDGDSYRRKTFTSYSPKVFAGISEISDVLQDRCVKIRMLKKNKDEHVERYKVDNELKTYIETLRGELYICALTYAAQIKEMYDANTIHFPKDLSDRECDIWESIFVISKFIDQQNDTQLEYEMKELAIQGSLERTRDNVIKNVSYKLLNSLLEVTETIEPIKSLDGIGYYSADEVFNLLKAQEDYDFLTSKRALTMELKTRFQIQSSRLTIKCEKISVYEISKDYLDDLLQRYNIMPIRATSDIAV